MKLSNLIDEILNEEKGELKALIGLEPNEPIRPVDARSLGSEIANIDNQEERNRYLAMAKALGGYYSGSNQQAQQTLTDIRNEIMASYNETREALEQDGLTD